MGPFPHDAAPSTISPANPVGTDGFAFVEFAHPDPQALEGLMRAMGYRAIGRHRARPVTLWQQGQVRYLTNAATEGFAARYAAAHGPSAVGMGWHVVDPAQAMAHATRLGATALLPEQAGALALPDAPALEGIGGSALYFVPQGEGWMAEFDPLPEEAAAEARSGDAGLRYIDHLTHNVRRGRMDHWAGFYRDLFGFREIKYFMIEGKMTGLLSRAMTSPCGKIRIPINESLDDKSQIEEFLSQYRGEGIQHIACGSDDLHRTVEALRARGLPFMPSPPDTYYERVDSRLPGHGEDLQRLRQNGLLIDGEGVVGDRAPRLLLQIFSGTVLGPIFFEFIQRKGDEGFGEGNFRALFESIEEDQIRRGVLAPAAE